MLIFSLSPPCWRGDYGHYLRRPDLKQEFVSEWQKYFNSSMWDSTRYDEQTKAELHLRLDVRTDVTSVCKYGLARFIGNFVHCLQELCERLWDISETRKEHGDRERDALMHGGRLEDQAAVLVNHHAILMQVAVVCNSLPFWWLGWLLTELLSSKPFISSFFLFPGGARPLSGHAADSEDLLSGHAQ